MSRNRVEQLAAVAAHNAALPAYQPRKWSRQTPRPVLSLVPPKVATEVDTSVPPKPARSFREFWMFLMMFAKARKQMADANAYRGREPRRLSGRSYARSQGYTDTTHMARVQKQEASERESIARAAAEMPSPMAAAV